MDNNVPSPDQAAAMAVPQSSSFTLQQFNIIVVVCLVLLILVLFLISLAKARSTCFGRRPNPTQPDLASLQPVGDRGLLVDGASATASNGFTAAEIAQLGKVLQYGELCTSEGAEEGALSTERSTAEDTKECVVCLGEYRETDTLRQLGACRHVFHQDCVDAWLLSKRSCPLCRTPLEILGDKDIEAGTST